MIRRFALAPGPSHLADAGLKMLLILLGALLACLLGKPGNPWLS